MGDQECCAAAEVPGGGFNRSNNPDYPATISSFRLDLYEVTVGRMRNFVADYLNNLPQAGDGKNPNQPSDPGWDKSWDATLPQTADGLKGMLGCPDGTYTDAVGSNENHPVNCVTANLSFAFCIWDGGRLPTEAEWNYAAAGGDEQRYYPWSVPPESEAISADHLVYLMASLAPVGSKSPLGDGRWGHADLGGSLWERVRDYFHEEYLMPCSDCVELTEAMNHGNRGGSFSMPADRATTWRREISTDGASGSIGFRCARSL